MKKLLMYLIVWNIAWSAHCQRLIAGSIRSSDGTVIAGAKVEEMNTGNYTFSNVEGAYSLHMSETYGVLRFSKEGFKASQVKLGASDVLDVVLNPSHRPALQEDFADEEFGATSRVSKFEMAAPQFHPGKPDLKPIHNTEGYALIREDGFRKVLDQPLSTFSLDVDVASYSNVRRFMSSGQLPPKDAVRIEELINYFQYDYPEPTGGTPFGIDRELARAPWNHEHLLLKVALQGKRIDAERLPPSNLVFLLDVSGSMGAPNKLPLLKSSFKMLVNELRPQDKVAIVVYAGAAGLVLPATSGEKKGVIYRALDKLQAGGSTAGGAGLELAYKIATENFAQEGNNRVIIATDGDFNVGASSNAAMGRLIEEKRKSGVYLTVLGFGMGNYKDDKLELLADQGNGNYAYIDNLREARKVLVSEFGGTLFTIAKDVKFQIEFNPAKIKGYRLIGYENRRLEAEDFNDDSVDAGELGSGHTVTALYELIPVGVETSHLREVDALKYQLQSRQADHEDWLTLKLRYKVPGEQSSRMMQDVVVGEPDELSQRFKWSAAVAGFGMLLRQSKFSGAWSYEDVLSLAKQSMGGDPNGYRTEFVNMVKSAQVLTSLGQRNGSMENLEGLK